MELLFCDLHEFLRKVEAYSLHSKRSHWQASYADCVIAGCNDSESMKNKEIDTQKYKRPLCYGYILEF